MISGIVLVYVSFTCMCHSFMCMCTCVNPEGLFLWPAPPYRPLYYYVTYYVIYYVIYYAIYHIEELEALCRAPAPPSDIIYGCVEYDHMYKIYDINICILHTYIQREKRESARARASERASEREREREREREKR